MSRLRLVTDDPEIYIQFVTPSINWPDTARAHCSRCGDIRDELPESTFAKPLPLNEVVIYSGWHLLKVHRKGEWF